MVDNALLPYADTKMKKKMSGRYKIAVKDLKKQLPKLLHRVEELYELNPIRTSSVHGCVWAEAATARAARAARTTSATGKPAARSV